MNTPEQSRNLNHECVKGLCFFDYHDIWHILSSFALLMGAPLVMNISYEPPIKTKRGQGELAIFPPEGNQSASDIRVEDNRAFSA